MQVQPDGPMGPPPGDMAGPGSDGPMGPDPLIGDGRSSNGPP